MSEEFAHLLERARHNDEQAIATLCQQYESRLRVVARVLLGPALRPHLDSMDLVQSVHRSLLIGFREEKYEFSSPEKLLALALTMVRRKVARHWRQLQRQKRLAAGTSSIASLPRALAELSEPHGDPAEVVQFHDELDHLCRKLDPLERQILELRLQGFSTGEIAEQVGLNHVTLRVRMTRLRERLRARGVLDEWF